MSRRILLYNPVSWRGHLDSWAGLFARNLMRRGHEVFLLTENAAAARDCAVPEPGRLTILPWARDLRPGHVRTFSNARDYLREFLKRHGKGIAPILPEKEMSPSVRRRKAFFGAVVPPLYALTASLFPRFIHPEERQGPRFAPPRAAALRIVRALRAAPKRPDLIFNLYLDGYDMTEEAWGRYESACPLPWVGIRFHPPDDPLRDGFYHLPSCRGAFFLDERIVQRYAAAFPDRHISFLPDVTDTRLPDAPTALEEEVRRRSAGRKIVFLGGTIGGQKDLATWYGVIRAADRGRFYFVQVGEVIESTMTPEDRSARDAAMREPPENLFILERFLPDEAEFNALIRSCDIIYAVYRDFRHSSNMLAKAASFERPILVSGRLLMGERVRRYSLGLTVAEGDVEGIAEALNALATRPRTSYGFAEYRSDLSEERFSDLLDACVEQCAGGG